MRHTAINRIPLPLIHMTQCPASYQWPFLPPQSEPGLDHKDDVSVDEPFSNKVRKNAVLCIDYDLPAFRIQLLWVWLGLATFTQLYMRHTQLFVSYGHVQTLIIILWKGGAKEAIRANTVKCSGRAREYYAS